MGGVPHQPRPLNPASGVPGEALSPRPNLNIPRARAIVAFIACALGLAIGRELDGAIPSTLWFAIACTLLIVCIATRSSRVIAGLLIGCMLLLSVGWFTLRIYERARPGPNFDQGFIEVEGVVLTSPRWREGDPITSHTDGWWRFNVELHRRILGPPDENSGERPSQPMAGVVWVRQTGTEAPAIRAGSRVRLSGRFESIDPPDNPGQTDLRLIAAQRGVVGSLVLPQASLIEELAPPTGVRASSLAGIAWLRARAADVVHRAAASKPNGLTHAPPSSIDEARQSQRRSLISGLLLGEYDPKERDVRDAFARQGLVHILSISGFHLTVLATLTLVLLRLLGDHGRFEFLAVGLIIATFMLVVPAQSPIVRSGVLVIAMLLVESTGRRYDRLTVLIWIALGLLLWRPLDLWSIGFQLSAGLTGVLLWKAEAFHHRLWRRWVTPELKGIKPVDHGLAGVLLGTVRASISTSLLCALVAAHAGLASVLGVFVGVIVTPVIVLALWVGYVALIVGMFVPPIAGLAAGVLGALAESAIYLVEFFDHLPMSSWRMPPVPWSWAIVATVVLGWLVACPRGATRALIAIAALATWLAIAWAPDGLRDRVIARVSSEPRVMLRVDMFSVGDASFLIVRSDDDAMIWDAGAPRSAGVLPQGVAWARAVGAWRVNTMVLSHADIDHYAAADTLIEPLGIRTVRLSPMMRSQWDEVAAANIRSGTRTPLDTVMRRTNAALSRHGGAIISTQRGDSWQLGHAHARVLWPPADFASLQPRTQDNDASLVMLLEVSTRAGARRLLLTGDISDPSLPTLRALEPGLHADAMEAPHHGTTTPGVLAWISEVNPSIVLQSAGMRKSDDRRLDALRVGRIWHATGRTGHAYVEIMSDGTLRTSTHRVQLN